ncbi:MAG: hypothetical protein ABI334_11050 [Candidatus Dormiibacterota bacterium]
MFFGATYLGLDKWFRAERELFSPDGGRFTYWANTNTSNEVHVVDVASGADWIVYSGPTFYIPIAFEADAIYLVHAINTRQGAFENLYRMDPSRGIPQLVPGSDRHMYQWGWIRIADGAAWGVDNVVQGNSYIYSVLRLNLATSEVTRWFEAPDNMFWPIGVDVSHRLYLAYQDQLLRLDAPSQVTHLSNPGALTPWGGPGGLSDFAADSRDVWLSGNSAVWLCGRSPAN